MSKFRKLLLVFSCFAVACSSGYVTRENSQPLDGFFGWLLQKRTLLHKNFDVTTEWQQIDLPASIDSNPPAHEIILEVKDWKQWLLGDTRPITNPQGQEVKIEVRLIDTDGNVYELQQFPSVDHITFYLLKKTGVKEGLTFTKLQIRGNVPFKCSQLIWERHYY